MGKCKMAFWAGGGEEELYQAESKHKQLGAGLHAHALKEELNVSQQHNGFCLRLRPAALLILYHRERGSASEPTMNSIFGSPSPPHI